MTPSKLLEIDNVAISFGGVHAVRGFSLSLHEGERVALIGPNGAGKSTIINLIAGNFRPDSGVVRYQGRDAAAVSAHGRARGGISRTFQNLELFLSMTVLENVMTALDVEVRIGRPWLGAKHRLPRRRRAMDALKLLGIDGYADTRAGVLPYGVRKLVELSRALVADPKLLLLDEPVAGLADNDKFVGLLAKALDECEAAVILVEHDMPTVQTLSRYVHVLDAGATIAEGTFEQVAHDPRVVEAYLGKSA